MKPAQLALLAACAVLASACSTAREVESAETPRCASCHGFPPPPFVAGSTAHPQSTSCYLCHADTVDVNGELLPGPAHMDGRVEVTTHALPFLAQHTLAALEDVAVCTQCHGVDYSGGESGRSCNGCHDAIPDGGVTRHFADWQTNCTFCHGTRTEGWTSTPAGLLQAAPPPGARGETQTSSRAVGAHAKHLVASEISAGVACTECHTIPATLAHVDGTAQVTFGTLARTGGASPAYAPATLTCSSTYCHGGTALGGSSPAPTWTGAAACGSCHGLPPPTGRHTIIAHTGELCANCHLDVADVISGGIQDDPAAKARHVNGTKDVRFPESGTWDPVRQTCSNVACHRGASIRGWRD